MTKSRNFLRCGLVATVTFLFGACNSDEVPLESASDSRSSDTDSDSNTNTDSNATPATPGSVSDSESDTNVPTGSDSNTDSNGPDSNGPDSTPTESDSNGPDSNGPSSDSNTDSSTDSSTDTDSDTDTAGVCEQPPASDECESCLYANCHDQYCTCEGDQKCLCVLNCLDGVTGGTENKLDDLLNLDLDGLLGGLLNDVLLDLFDDLTDQDYADLGGLLTCLTSDPCGVPLNLNLDDILMGGDINDLPDLLDANKFEEILEKILEVSGNSLDPLLTCAELTNPDGECGTLCPVVESVLD